MTRMWKLLVTTLLGLCLLTPGSLGILLVSKKLSGPGGHLRLVRGENTTVSITLHNAGQEKCVNATLHDQTFNNGSAWRLVAGRNYQKVPDLLPGASHSVQFTVVPRVKGTVRSFPAVVKYATEKQDGKFTAYSNFKAVYVQPYSRFQSTLYELAGFAGFLVFCAALYAILIKPSTAKDKKK